ncbi:MAG TPA: penicillin-binding protein activator LpoB [Gammaproteobacteria bacterium]
MKRGFRYLLAMMAAIGLGMLSACSTTPTVERISPDQVTDVSGYWNDTDANLTAQQMISQMLGDPWLGNYERGHGGQQPTVIVGDIRNLSSEHISVSTFIDDMQRELINSGKVQFVASSNQRGEVRDERKDQDLNATAATRSAMGQEIGADYMMQGTINTIIDAAGDKAVKYYQVDLQLINMHNNVIAWLGQKKIKKVVEHGRFRP